MNETWSSSSSHFQIIAWKAKRKLWLDKTKKYIPPRNEPLPVDLWSLPRPETSQQTVLHWGWAPPLLTSTGRLTSFFILSISSLSLSPLPFSYTSDTTRRRTSWLSYLSEPIHTQKELTGYDTHTHILLPSWLYTRENKAKTHRSGIVDTTEERWPTKTKRNYLVTTHLCPDFLGQMDLKWSYWLAVYRKEKRSPIC